MKYAVRTAVVGAAASLPFLGPERSLEEELYHLGRAALADAGMTHDDLDGIVVGCNDQLDGRAISVMMASGPLGGVGRDILSTPSASEHAFIMGVLRIASGLHRTQLVVAWNPTEARSPAECERLAADPYFHRRLPLDGLSAGALQASAIEHAVPGAREAALSVIAKNRRHGAVAHPGVCRGPADSESIRESRVLRWPLREAMVSPPIAGAVALVLASEDRAAGDGSLDAAWILGMGWATEAAFLGDRALSTAPALTSAARQAYAEARIESPAAQLDLAEVSDATPYEELIACESLGLCARARWQTALANGELSRGGSLPVNLSGGALTLNAGFANGLARIAEAANQVRGRAGSHQLRGAKTALAHAASGPAMQYQTAVVLGAARSGT